MNNNMNKSMINDSVKNNVNGNMNNLNNSKFTDYSHGALKKEKIYIKFMYIRIYI